MGKHKSGGIITASHSTMNDVTVPIVKYLDKIKSDYPLRVSLGIISRLSGKKSSDWSVKIIDDTTCILIRATQKTTIQEIRIYTSCRQEVKLALAQFVNDNNWKLRFGKRG